MSVLDATRMVQIDVLVGILAGEIDVVGWLAEVHGARHACVAISNTKSAGIADVPI
jgi:hypothetical protein